MHTGGIDSSSDMGTQRLSRPISPQLFRKLMTMMMRWGWQCCSSAYLSYLFINNLMARWFAPPLFLVIVTRANHHGLGLYITLLQV